MQENNSSRHSHLQMITLFRGVSLLWHIVCSRLFSSHIPVRTGVYWTSTSAELEQVILPSHTPSGPTPGIHSGIQKGTEKDNIN